MDKRTTNYFTAATIAAVTMGIASALAGGLLGVEFSDLTFSTPTKIDNPYWPLLPGGVATTFI